MVTWATPVACWPVTSLGMPSLPPPTDPVWKQAWDDALYGVSGYLRSHPVTAAVSEGTALALVDSLISSTSGEVALLGSAGRLATALAGQGVPVRFDVPLRYDGLVIAADWLSHVPCHVVELDTAGHPRLVHVSPVTGLESLGARLSETSVPQSIGLWLERWWPVVDFGVGARAEVGTTRDAAWDGIVSRLGAGGVAVAIEPAHLAPSRPFAGSMQPRGGTAIPDGTRDLLAAVALDAVAQATTGRVVTSPELSYVVSRPWGASPGCGCIRP
jgi:hypothetical protein